MITEPVVSNTRLFVSLLLNLGCSLVNTDYDQGTYRIALIAHLTSITSLSWHFTCVYNKAKGKFEIVL